MAKVRKAVSGASKKPRSVKQQTPSSAARAKAFDALTSVFEERAEHLSRDELAQWTTYTQHDESIIDRLMGPGAKLISGPRGSGKSTLLRTAFFRLVQARDSLPIYVNYAKSLALEPLFHTQANALQLFRQWLLMKIVLGAAEAFREMELPAPEDLAKLSVRAAQLVSQLATGNAPTELAAPLSPKELSERLESWMELKGLRRCVLLLDDAAHAFSPEQQREFFEVFRELRSRRISPKAAVYPGITSYSPFFHVGHEAETIQAWYRPDEPGYLPAMRALVTRRLPAELASQFTDRVELIDFLALACFGLPRGFLNMISEVLGVGEGETTKPTRQRAEAAVAAHADSVRGIFRALAAKLPRYRHFVDVGKELEAGMVRTLKEYNRLQVDAGAKASVVALEEPISAEVERMLNMLEYAGVVRKVGTVSRGVKGRFQRYTVHHSIVASENALSLGRSYTLAAVIDALRARTSHAFTRTKESSLLSRGWEKRCTLALPPCAKCSTPRMAEEQHFCMKCGAPLTDVSIYEDLLRTPISLLPLTQRKIDGILNSTKIRTVHDLLLDDERQEVRKVRGVGPFWAKQIRTIAEEFVSV